MRLSLLFALAIALTPSATTAQAWKDWAKQHPTYPSQSEAAPAASQPTPAVPQSQTSSARPIPSIPPIPGPSTLSEPSSPLESTKSPLFTQMFMKGCMSAAGERARPYCACTLGEIQNRYTYEQFAQLVQGQDAPQVFQELAMSCVHALQ